MSYGVYLVKTLYRSYLRIGEQAEHEVHSLLMVGHVVHYLFLLSIGHRHLYECPIEPYPLRSSGSHDRVVVHGVELVFDGRAAAIKY